MADKEQEDFINFQQALDEVLGSVEFARALGQTYAIARAAFIAGWKASGSGKPVPGILPFNYPNIRIDNNQTDKG